jgi:hypothetical protein
MEPEYVRNNLAIYCIIRPRCAAGEQWEYIIGAAIGVGFKLMTRYDDLRQLRWDDENCEVHSLYICYFVSCRKSSHYKGQHIDVARPADTTETGVYQYAVTARCLCSGLGFVLPAIVVHGRIDGTTAMDCKLFVEYLREELQCTSFSADDANKYSGQSLRACAATAGVTNGLHPRKLCRAAGVSSINWVLWYNRCHLADRIRISRSLGL